MGAVHTSHFLQLLSSVCYKDTVEEAAAQLCVHLPKGSGGCARAPHAWRV